MQHTSTQACYWYDYHADPRRTEVIDHALDHCTYAVTEWVDANGEGWNFRLQLLLQGPQPA